MLNRQSYKLSLKALAEENLNFQGVNLPIETRLSIWKSLLNIKSLKKIYSYENIVKTIKNTVPYISARKSSSDISPEINTENRDNQQQRLESTITKSIDGIEIVESTSKALDFSSGTTSSNDLEVTSSNKNSSPTEINQETPNIIINNIPVRVEEIISSKKNNNNNDSNDNNDNNNSSSTESTTEVKSVINGEVILNNNEIQNPESTLNNDFLQNQDAINSGNLSVIGNSPVDFPTDSSKPLEPLSNPNKKSFSPELIKNFETILLDVHRTFFRIDIEPKRAMISNILKAIIYVSPGISYCQGMSYIASFILEICKNEEDAFFLLLGIFTHTNYCEIFYKDLYKLKQYFSIFEKAISLVIPECQQYLSSSSLSSSFYSSSWFITLFTNCLQNIIDYDNPKFLLSIWDNFILLGWQAIINAGLVLMKYYSEDILMLRFEDLLHFLLNDITRASFIQNINYEKFTKHYFNINFELEAFKALEFICVVEERNALKSGSH